MGTRPKRIRLVGPDVRSRGGIAQFNTELARTLQVDDRDVDVAVFGFKRTYPRFSRAGRQGADPSGSLESVESHAVLVPWLPWTWVSASRRAGLGSGDLLIVQWWHPITALCTWYLTKQARKRKAGAVAVCHNARPHEPFPFSVGLSRLALRQASLLIALSQPVASELRELVPGADVQVLSLPPYAVFDPDAASLSSATESWRTRLGLTGEDKVVLFFGNVRPYKGLADLIEAFPIVHEQTGATLLVVGTFFESLNEYQERIRDLGIADRVRLVDEYVPNEDVAPLFALADVVALPYRSASQSAVLPIAAVMRKPVVATSVGGLPEALDGTGLLVPPRDPRALGGALTRALESPPAPPPIPEDAWQAWADALARAAD